MANGSRVDRAAAAPPPRVPGHVRRHSKMTTLGNELHLLREQRHWKYTKHVSDFNVFALSDGSRQAILRAAIRKNGVSALQEGRVIAHGQDSGSSAVHKEVHREQ